MQYWYNMITDYKLMSKNEPWKKCSEQIPHTKATDGKVITDVVPDVTGGFARLTLVANSCNFEIGKGSVDLHTLTKISL